MTSKAPERRVQTPKQVWEGLSHHEVSEPNSQSRSTRRSSVLPLPRITIQCEMCGEEVKRLVAGGHQKPRTCGATCRSRLYRLRQKTPPN